MNQSEDFGKILKPWPNLVDHFRYLLVDSQRVHPWMLDRPVHGADGRLTNDHGAPFWHLRSLEVLKARINF